MKPAKRRSTTRPCFVSSRRSIWVKSAFPHLRKSATTLLKFRRLLDTHDLGRAIFDRVNALLASRGLKVAGGTMVDATIIHAPNSTKNAEKSRDPEMHQTRKGNQWYFVRCAHLASRDRRKWRPAVALRPGGMKLHIGADTKSGLIHSAHTTAANVHDSQVLPDLLHGAETRVYGDSRVSRTERRDD